MKEDALKIDILQKAFKKDFKSISLLFDFAQKLCENFVHSRYQCHLEFFNYSFFTIKQDIFYKEFIKKTKGMLEFKISEHESLYLPKKRKLEFATYKYLIGKETIENIATNIHKLVDNPQKFYIRFSIKKNEYFEEDLEIHFIEKICFI